MALCTVNEMNTARSVVATGPPTLCAMFSAVFATAILAFGIDEYAADIDGMLIVP